MKRRVSRRTLLQAGAGGAVGAALAGAVPLARESTPRDIPKLRALSPSGARAVAAAAERIWPGAGEAGVLAYIDGALATAYAQDMRLYRRGLARLDAAALRQHGSIFAKSTPEQQDALLASLETGTLAELPEAEGRAFFARLRAHVMEGVLSDPIYGGNRDLAGWKAVGYPGPYRGYTAEQQLSTQPLELPYQSLEDL